MEELITFIDDRINFYERMLNRVTKIQQDLSNSNSYNRTLNNDILIDEINSVLCELKCIRNTAETIKNAEKT